MYSSYPLTKGITMEVDSKYHATQEAMMIELAVINEAKVRPEKFEVLYHKYFEQIYYFLFQRIDDVDATKDLAQEVFYKAMINLGKYEFRGVPFSSWLYRIAQNELNMYFRKSNKQRALNIDDEHLDTMMEEMEENVMDKEKQYDKLATVIAGMEADDVQLIEMRFFESRSFKEIGEILDITENNAKVKTYRVLDKVKKLLS